MKFQEDNPFENWMWKKEEVVNLQKATKKFPAGTKNRWDKIGELVKTKSTNQIIQMTHYLTTNPTIKIEGDIDLNLMLNPKTKKPPKEEEKEEIKVVKKTSNTVQVEAANEEEVWSEEQQKSLEAALKKYPSSLSANERWGSISKDVPGKSKKQCVDRYKYLSSLIKKK